MDTGEDAPEASGSLPAAHTVSWHAFDAAKASNRNHVNDHLPYASAMESEKEQRRQVPRCAP
jgi:hypothetical protein